MIYASWWSLIIFILKELGVGEGENVP